MNADIKGMLLWHKRGKNFDGLIETSAGKKLSDRDAKNYLQWCLANGYGDLKYAPEYEDIVEKLQPKTNL